ncbi:MAG: protein-S-isoprenylcysteine O-methyltransferase [Pseudomonadota bacterium]
MRAGNIAGIIVALALLTAVIWRLPINGWGSLLWFASVTVMGIIRRPHESTAQTTATTESRQSTVENVLLAGVAIGSAALPALHLATGLFSFANYATANWWPLTGIPVAMLGLWLFWRSHVDLGKNWSVSLELREDHGLITSGVYQRIRHPMYTSIFLLYLAQAIFISNWIAGFSGLITFGAMYLVRTPREEAMMYDQFGAAYEDYCTRSGRLIPRLKV